METGNAENPLPMSSLSTEHIDIKAISPAESTISDKPIAPKSSRQSYDGRDHHSHKEARGNDLTDALERLVEDDTGEAAATAPDDARSKNPTKFLARTYNEKKIMAETRKIPPKHDYTGYTFSRQSARPRGLKNYFLPVVNQPTPRKHIAAPLSQVPMEVLHTSLKSAPPGLMPLSAVRVTWRSTTRHTVYTLSDLYMYLSRYGPIEGVYQRSANSAVVIFCDLASARSCVRCPALGLPWDPLVATWWEPKLHNQGYLARHVRQEDRNSLMAIEGPVLKDQIPTTQPVES